MLLFSSHPATSPGWGETFVSLHRLPARLTPPIAMETWGMRSGATLRGWEASATPGKASHRRRGAVVRLGASAGVSPGPSRQDECRLALPFPLTPRRA